MIETDQVNTGSMSAALTRVVVFRGNGENSAQIPDVTDQVGEAATLNRAMIHSLSDNSRSVFECVNLGLWAAGSDSKAQCI